MADEDRIIITKLVIQAAEAIASLETFDERLDATKQKLGEIAGETGKSIGEIGEELKKAFEGEILKGFTDEFGKVSELTDVAKGKIAELNNVIDQAVPLKIFEQSQQEIQYANQLRSEVDSVKIKMQELAQVSDDSFRVINAGIKSVRLEELQNKLVALKAALSVEASGFIDADVQSSGKMDAIRLQIAEVNKEIQLLRQAAPIALQEMANEAKQIGPALQPAVTTLQQLVKDGERLKQIKFAELMKPLDIVSEDEVEQVRQLAQELGSLEDALKQQDPDLQITDQLREQLQTIESEMNQFAQQVNQDISQINIEQLKPKVAALGEQLKSIAQTTNTEFAKVAAQMKKTFEAETIEKFGAKTEAAKVEIAEYNEALGLALKNVTKETRQAEKAQAEYVKITKQGYGEMSVQAQQYGQQVQKTAQVIQRTAQSSGQSWNQVGQRMARLGTPINQVNTALQQLNSQTKKTTDGVQGLASRLGGITSGLSNLGGVGKLVFGSILGIGAVQALQRVTRAFVDFAKEILQRGTEMTEVIFTLEVAIRGLQRIGLDTTIGSWTDQIQKLKKEFPFFPKREFIEATSLAALMTREFGFTEQQIANIVRQSAILAQVTGKDLTESVRGITFAIGSGYFESLQRAGVNISRAVVKNEALAQGYAGVYNELEPAIRASVTYSVIQNNLNSIQDDASEKARTFAGQVQILTSSLEDLKNLFGQVVTSSDTFIGTLETLNELVGSIQSVYEALSGLNLDIFAPFKAFTGIDTIIENIETLTVTLQALANTIVALGQVAGTLGTIIGAIGTVAGAFGLDFLSETLEKVQEELFNLERSLGDLAKTEKIEIPIKIGELEFDEEDYQEILDATEELNEKIFEIEEDAAKRRLDVFEDYRSDVEKNAEGHYRKMEDLAQDHQDKLDDIELKRSQKIADEITNYNLRVADAQRDAAFRREEAERKYRERELKDERKFQEKLRQLRENFLFDLEDAVRERDARQIIRLIRQYNLRRDQMVREEKLSKDDKQSAFEEDLRQIEFQRQERLRQLAVEHSRRLKEIDIQAERERTKAALEFQRRQADEQERWNKQKEERNERLAEQLADLDTATQERINKIISGLQEEYGLTNEQLDAIALLWENTYGPDGRIDVAIGYTLARMAQLLAWMNLMKAQQQAFKFANIPPGGYLGTPPDDAGGQAKGGTIIARKPTVALFGEAGPEMATFTPLNNLAETTPFGGQAPEGARDSKMGKLRLEMLLSPDLEARIVDDTLNEVADVIYTIERERR